MKLSPKDLEIIKAIKASNKASLKRLKKQKSAQEALKLLDDYFVTHGKIPSA